MRPTLKFIIIIIIIIIIIRHELGLCRPVSVPLNSIHKTKNKHTQVYVQLYVRFYPLFFYNLEEYKHNDNNMENLLKMKFVS